MDDRDGDLTAAEQRAFGDLPRELDPPPELEDRIVSALARRGEIRARRPGMRGAPLLAAAAGLALLAAGFLLGRSSARSPEAAPTAPRFALFLLRGEERGAGHPEEEAGRVAEYRAWARGLAGTGRSVTGEKLEDSGERLGGPPLPAAPEEEIRGFFVISAASFEDALAVARGCPHLRHGGRILVRPIAPV